ncbi:RNA polymerase sigma factor [Portibacter lacus]|uniref:DNA-directed RNA polymerase sigma-70 factor n=1 Tax=Portibacter lacus TaxID=1099794 RepID=A0AA37WET2_9BACT|nr:sigma-70 family RNA polymerase sigma factor [Portibacter lacus]GLR18193.1 DNA-directed RNA polymerase sigma-70 factor [Portibacter lacus]
MDVVLDLQHNEESFIQACVRNEKWAQKKLYEDYYGAMMPLCMRYTNNREDALDVLHEGFIKVFRNISKYKPGTSLNSWIRRIMVNTSIDYYRKMSRRRTEDLDAVFDVSSSDPDALSEMSAQEIIDALQLLTPAYRTVFNLYVIEGYPHKEIAKILNITESTSRSNLVKARTKLKNILLAKSKIYGE